MGKKVYAIKEGFDALNNVKIENKIVATWAECLKYVKGVKGAKYKSFESKTQAEEYLNNNNQGLKKEDGNYPLDCLHVYVDGSYNSETKEYSYGMVAVKDSTVLDIEGESFLSKGTNNIRQIAGELKAAVRGAEYALENNEKKVVIFHDYAGICYHATGFWDRKEESSKEYYEKMQGLMKKGIEIIFVKVDSHTGDLFNELADEKCKESLRIPSDNVVAKHLKNNVIYVKDISVKDEIIKITSGNSANIICKDSNLTDEIEEIQESRIDYNDEEEKQEIIKKINEKLNQISLANLEKVLKYVKRIKKD